MAPGVDASVDPDAIVCMNKSIVPKQEITSTSKVIYFIHGP